LDISYEEDNLINKKQYFVSNEQRPKNSQLYGFYSVSCEVPGEFLLFIYLWDVCPPVWQEEEIVELALKDIGLIWDSLYGAMRTTVTWQHGRHF
jgi:hypothetical protein